MKTKSLKPTSKIVAAHNKIVRHEGQSYLIRSQKLGPIILADAEPMPQGGQPIDLFGRKKLAVELRGLVEAGCFS
jgi:hypothetical protein